MKTIENQYMEQFEMKDSKGLTSLGVKSSHTYNTDPKRLLFSMARYKFVSKMLVGMDRVVEVGCGDAFCSRLVAQTVNSLTVSDIDPLNIDDVNKRYDKDWPLETLVHNILKAPFSKTYHAAYSLDVIEHILPEKSNLFLEHICKSLKTNGMCIIGTPSLSSQKYASKLSRLGHINCMNADQLSILMETYFQQHLMFSMNDEVVHTGFSPMANYLISIGISPK